MKLKIGEYVRHATDGWGPGLVDDAKRTIVYFRNVGIKKFATSQGTFALIAGERTTRKSLPVKSRFGL